MTLPTDPPWCTQCGRRPEDCTTTVRAEWTAQDETLCPLCVRNWAKLGPAPVEGRCAGCGAKKKATALKAGVCSRCRRRGVSAPSLFDPEPEPVAPGFIISGQAPEVTKAVADYLATLPVTVTPPSHTPGDDPLA